MAYNHMDEMGGSYMVQSPLLESIYLEPTGWLTIAVIHLVWHSTEYGMLEAYIDPDTLLGSAMLGLVSDRTA